jgi:asparagine synthase (glutamine-hydrolysing)
MIPRTETTRGRNMFRYLSRLLSALAEPPELRNVSWYSCFSPLAKESLYSEQFKALLTGNAVNYMKDLFVNASARDLMDKTFYTDIHSYLPECLLVKMDIASMANSLEARSPFLDHKLMEFSASLPASWKLHGLTSKYILRRTFDDLLPPEITRRGKMGFGIPVGRWFRGDWKEYYRDTVLSPLALSRGYFRKETLERMYTEHTSGLRDHGYRMWALLILELWHREYLKDFKLP